MADTSASRSPRKKRAPARTIEAREKQLGALAYDLAEEQILKGTASSQVITHFLKLVSTTTELEKEKIRQENILLAAKAEQLASMRRYEETAQEAIAAMRRYRGDDEPRE